MANKVKVEFNDEERLALSKKLSERRDRLRKEMEERREAEIEKSLSEIYRDDDGKKIDVNRMKIKRRQGFVFWFFNALVVGLIGVVLSIGVYYYVVYGKGDNSSSLSLEIESPGSVAAGEEFSYKVKYKNPEYVAIKNVSLSLSNSENFILIATEPKLGEGESSWNIGRIDPRSEGEIIVRGRVIDKAKSSSVILAQMTYTPENFSSEFKKESSATLIVRDVGFETFLDYSGTALVNQQGEFKMNFNPLEKNLFPEFIIRLEKGDNVEIKNTIISGRRPNENVPSGSFKVEKMKDFGESWLASGLSSKESFEVIYRVKEKLNEKESIKIFLEQDVAGKRYVFWEKDISLEVMKSDLNLTLLMNGSQNDKPVNFGDTLNYSIVYSNKGETAMRDVVIMMALGSDFVDWASLKDENNGSERGNTIVWTKEEVSALAEIGVNKGGSIDFSVNVLPFSEGDLDKDFQIKAFAQYNIGSLAGGEGSSTVPAADQDSRSNTIISLINSDMTFREELRYFDENNLPVGNGPLPPKVDEKTSFKVYWTLANNLHDLNEVGIETVLPEGVEWDDRNRTSVGTLVYDESQRKVIWQIGRLPITVFRADAEFNISFTPKDDDRNRIVVLLAGAKAKAVDAKTASVIEKTGQPKTTKLDDDEIANLSSDGRIR
jgi:hypothetical protein